MDYADWRMAQPQIEQPAQNVPSPWELKRKALAEALKAKNDPYWQQTWEGADTVETRDVDFMPWPNVNGWAACDKARKHCVLIMKNQAPDYGCTLEHEETHAAGYDHPAGGTHLNCRNPYPWQPWK